MGGGLKMKGVSIPQICGVNFYKGTTVVPSHCHSNPCIAMIKHATPVGRQVFVCGEGGSTTNKTSKNMKCSFAGDVVIDTVSGEFSVPFYLTVHCEKVSKQISGVSDCELFTIAGLKTREVYQLTSNCTHHILRPELLIGY